MKLYKTIGSLERTYFRIGFENKGTNILNYYLKQINIEEYFIYKFTNKQREITIEELLLEKYSGYIFFKKDTYSNIEINSWLKYLKDLDIEIKYLCKPLPPDYIKQKIEIL